MATAVIKHTYELKRGNEDALNRANPFLLRGEPVVVFNNDGTVNMKIGDGVNYYKDLPFVNNLPDSLQVDWNEVDPNSAHFVKSKPMYKQVSETVKDFTFNDFDVQGIATLQPLQLVEGNVYKVVVGTNDNTEFAVFNVQAKKIKLEGLFEEVIVISDNIGNVEKDISPEYFTIIANSLEPVTGFNVSQCYSYNPEITSVTIKDVTHKDIEIVFDDDYVELFQADYDEHNPHSPNYIKGKPFSKNKTVKTIDIVYDVNNIIPNSNPLLLKGPRVGLQKGKTYTVEVTTTDGTTQTTTPIECTPIEFDTTVAGLNAGTVTCLTDNGLVFDLNNGNFLFNYFAIIDNVIIDADGYLVEGDGSVVVVVDTVVKGVIKNVEYEGIEYNVTQDYVPLMQSDYEDGNSDSPNYIRNKPFGTEYEEIDGLVLNKDNLQEYVNSPHIGLYPGSFGLQLGQEYTVDIISPDGNYSGVKGFCVDSFDKYEDYNTLVLPDGALAFMVTIETGETVPLLLQNCLISNQGTLEFNASYSMVPGYEDGIEIRIFGEDLPKSVIKTVTKLDNKYLNIDQEFKPESENAQSGKALGKVIRNLTGKLIVPGSLDEGYLKIAENTVGTYKDCNIYTKGLGSRDNLKTKNKTTLVDAINENVDAINENVDAIKNRTTLATADSEVVWINGEPKILTDSYIPYTEQPYYYSKSIGAGDDIVFVLPHNQFVNLTQRKLYTIDNKGNIKKTDLKVYDTHQEQFNKISRIISVFYYGYSAYIYMDYEINDTRNTSSYTSSNNYRFVTKNNDETYSRWYISDNYVNYSGELTDISTSTYTPIGTYYDESFSQSSYDGGTWPNKYTKITTKAPSICYGFEQTEQEKPGLLKGYRITFGAEDYTNAQIRAIHSRGYNFFRALQADGTEVVNIYKANVLYPSYTKTGIDNNEHSGYLKLDDDTIMCLSSSGEILYRNIDFFDNETFATITKRKTVTTETDLFTQNLQYVKLHIHGDTLYATRHNNIYAINYLDDNPTAVRITNNLTAPSIEINSCGTNLVNLYTRNINVSLTRKMFNPNDPLDNDLEYIFDGGTAPTE